MRVTLYTVVGQRPGGREFGVRGGGEGVAVGRCSGQYGLGRAGPPGPRGDRAEGQPGFAHDAVLDVERGGDRADREGVRGTLAHLAVAGAGGDRGGRQGDAGDQRAGRQGGLAVRGVTDREVEVGQRQLAGPVEGFVADDGVEGGEGHAHVGGVDGHAVVGEHPDGVVVVLARERGATAAGGTLVARACSGR
ncbi:hypothetical protein SVIOM342S_08481 [Streptomyces violaceorubidus]